MKKYLLLTAIFISILCLGQGVNEKTIREKMKADGLSEKKIDELLLQRKEIEKNKNYMSNLSLKKNPSVNSACNMSAENGWDNWQWQIGSNSGVNPPVWAGTLTTSPTSPDFSITFGPGFDPNAPGPNVGNPPLPVVCPSFGNFSIKIGRAHV